MSISMYPQNEVHMNRQAHGEHSKNQSGNQAFSPSEFIAGEVGYIQPGVEKPYNYMYEPPTGIARDNCEYAYKRVFIRNGRHIRRDLSIDIQGFELLTAPTCVKNFYDTEEVKAVYYDEVRRLALTATGATRAYVFDHLVRKREAGRPPLTFGRHGDGSRPAAVGRVHNDYSEESGNRRLSLVLKGQSSDCGQRFAIVNVWRSITGPILDTPLAVCDARSLKEEDLVVAEIRYQDRTGEIYLSKYNESHQWHYFPRMVRDEALIFKQFDSNPQVARFTLHSAFDLPEIPPDAPLRESIEARCLVVYG